MGQKQKIHAEASAENVSGPHDVGRPSAPSPHGDSSGGPLLFSAFASAYIVCFVPHIVFSAFGPYCIFCHVFYQLPCMNCCEEEQDNPAGLNPGMHFAMYPCKDR